MTRIQILCALMLSGAAVSHASLLGSYTGYAGFGGIGRVSGPTSMRFAIGTEVTCFKRNTCTQMFLLENLTSASVGSTYTLDSSDADFAAVRDYLTNGAIEPMTVSTAFGPYPDNPGGGSVYYEDLLSGIPGVDFAGLDIHSLVLRIDSITRYEKPFGFYDPATGLPMLTTDEDIYYTLAVYGSTPNAPVTSTPEPATWMMIAAGGFLAAIRKTYC